jgi:hypothetical protein
VDEGSRKEEKGSWSQADGDGKTKTRRNPNPKLGKTGHRDRSRKPEARWVDIGHGREDDDPSFIVVTETKFRTVEKMISYLSLPVHHFSNNSAFTPQTL